MVNPPRSVVVLDAQGEVAVALGERLERLVHRRLGVARHRQQLLLQLVQFHVKMFHNDNLVSPTNV